MFGDFQHKVKLVLSAMVAGHSAKFKGRPWEQSNMPHPLCPDSDIIPYVYEDIRFPNHHLKTTGITCMYECKGTLSAIWEGVGSSVFVKSIEQNSQAAKGWVLFFLNILSISLAHFVYTVCGA